MRRSDADNRAIGGTLNLNPLWSKLGTFSISYNDDRRYNSHYYTADYYQTLFSGAFGSLGLRAGIQRFNNGGGGSSSSTGKYIALDFTPRELVQRRYDPPERLYDGKPFRP